jgi:hypothetical protein
MSDFDLARQVGHLIVQPADRRQNPPESYLFVQDGLIISCGVLYALCYIFCMIRTYADKTYPGARWGSIQFLYATPSHFTYTIDNDSSLTMAYEIFYAFTITSTRSEKLAFLAWFELDLSFVIVALQKAHTPAERRVIRRNMILGCLAGIAFLWMLTRRYPDEREQVTAYWTGIILQLPIGWICLYQLWEGQSTKGHSLEIWYVHYAGLKGQANDPGSRGTWAALLPMLSSSGDTLMSRRTGGMCGHPGALGLLLRLSFRRRFIRLFMCGCTSRKRIRGCSLFSWTDLVCCSGTGGCCPKLSCDACLPNGCSWEVVGSMALMYDFAGLARQD